MLKLGTGLMNLKTKRQKVLNLFDRIRQPGLCGIFLSALLMLLPAVRSESRPFHLSNIKQENPKQPVCNTDTRQIFAFRKVSYTGNISLTNACCKGLLKNNPMRAESIGLTAYQGRYGLPRYFNTSDNCNNIQSIGEIQGRLCEKNNLMLSNWLKGSGIYICCVRSERISY